MRKALLVVAVLIATLGMIAGAIWGGLEGGDRLWPATWLVWAAMGALILWKRPKNGVGMTMLWIGLGFGLSFIFLALSHSPAQLEVRVWFELVNVVFGVLPWLGIIWLLLVFPSGRLAGWWERFAAIGVGLLGVFGVLAFTFSPIPMEATGEPSPISTDWGANATGWFVGEEGFMVVIAVTAGAIVSLVRRFRRSTGAERHQYRWLLFGALIYVLVIGIGQILPEDSFGMYLWLLAGSAMPIAVGIAVTRYRLFEIDRLLSRTVTYALLVAGMISLFGLVVVWLPNRIPGVDQSPFLVAAATLAVAAIFNPVRRRLQVAVDRRFNRSRYDAERVMADFTGSLQDRVDVDGVVDGWVGVVNQTMQPTSVGIWVRR